MNITYYKEIFSKGTPFLINYFILKNEIISYYFIISSQILYFQLQSKSPKILIPTISFLSSNLKGYAI